MDANAAVTEVLELFGETTSRDLDWAAIAKDQTCPFLRGRCIKVRKSQPEISIGTCTVAHGRDRRPMMICPFRLLERNQIFVDCLHLLSAHEPGNGQIVAQIERKLSSATLLELR